jgi:hypothetical protein
MNETAPLDGPAIVERLLQRVEDEAGLGGAGHSLQPTIRRANVSITKAT